MALGPHLCCEIGIFLVDEIVATVSEERHGLNRESEYIMVSLFVEPVHEMLLEP